RNDRGEEHPRKRNELHRAPALPARAAWDGRGGRLRVPARCRLMMTRTTSSMPMMLASLVAAVASMAGVEPAVAGVELRVDVASASAMAASRVAGPGAAPETYAAPETHTAPETHAAPAAHASLAMGYLLTPPGLSASALRAYAPVGKESGSSENGSSAEPVPQTPQPEQASPPSVAVPQIPQIPPMSARKALKEARQ